MLSSRSLSARGLFFIARCQRSSRALADAFEISATRLAFRPNVGCTGSSRRAAVSIVCITFLLLRATRCLLALSGRLAAGQAEQSGDDATQEIELGEVGPNSGKPPNPPNATPALAMR